MSSEHDTPHVLPLSVYLGIGTTLLVLTIVTVMVAQYDLGNWNLAVAMIIAASKASLVALYFMHLKYDHKIYGLIFAASLLFLATFIIITMLDTERRGDIYEYKAGPINENAAMYDTTIVDSVAADTVQPDSLSVADTTLEK